MICFDSQKHRDANATAELSSLKYTQKLIDLRISILQNNRSETAGEQRPMSNLPILSLDELLNVELALSYYLDYLSVMNLQKYVIFYLMARGKSYNPAPSILKIKTSSIPHANRVESNDDTMLGRVALE